MHSIQPAYSGCVNPSEKSVIRELLKLTQRSDIISFAGGLPAPETFPVDALRAAADRVLATQGTRALQYGTTEGDTALRKALVEYEAKDGIKAGIDNILITSSSQQALDMVPKLFLDPGEWLIAGRPTYMGALQAIQAYKGKVLGIPFSSDNDGFDFGELERRYAAAKAAGHRIKYIYVIPDFQNPTGICWSLAARKTLLEFSYRTGLFIVEDSPYREIRFMGKSIPSIYQLDQEGRNEGNVIGLKTFSKILAPGTRIGWILARADVIDKFVTAKQSMDLCTSPFTQMWLADYLATGDLDRVLSHTKDFYFKKRSFMMDMLDRYMPKRPDLRWTKPEGGLFLWISLPEFFDTEKLLPVAVEHKVAYVAGSAFYMDEPEHNAMRINFSYPSFENLELGVKRLAEVFSEEIARHEKA